MMDMPKVSTPSVVGNRDEIRRRIFSGNHKPRSELVEFFGAHIEIRQLRVEDMILMSDVNNEGPVSEKNAIIRTLLHMAFEPGTDNKVFEPADVDTLLNLPYGADFTRVAKAVETLTNVNLTEGKES